MGCSYAFTPANLAFEQAAAVPVAALTALQGLRDRGRMRAGQKVLVFTRAGQRYDLILDMAGTHSLADCRRALTPRGTHVVVGVPSGRWLRGPDRFLKALVLFGRAPVGQRLGGISDDFSFSGQQTSDGGYVVAGYPRSFGGGDADVYVARLGPE